MVGQQDSNVSKLIRARACTQTEALMETFASGPTKPSASISQVWPVAPPFGQIHIQRRLQNPRALVVAQHLTSNPHPCWFPWLWNKTSVPLWASLYSLQIDVHSDIGKSWKNTWNTSKVQGFGIFWIKNMRPSEVIPGHLGPAPRCVGCSCAAVQRNGNVPHRP